MSSTSTRTDRTDRSISDRLQAALPRPAERPFDRCGATASVASYMNMCRSHEVTGFSAPTGLLREHIDFFAGTLRIAQSVQRADGRLQVLPTKTRRSNRTVPLPDRCRYALAHHHAGIQRRDGRPGAPGRPDGYVFGTANGTPLDPRNLTRMFGELCRTLELRTLRLHDLRHTCVSLLLAQGVHPRVVMEIVGHSAIEMTMNVYGHVHLDTQRRALDGLDEGLGGQE